MSEGSSPQQKPENANFANRPEDSRDSNLYTEITITGTAMNTDSTQPQVSPFQSKRQFFLTPQILPVRIYRTLSKDAHKIFAGIWNRLNNYTADSIWIMNTDLCRLAHIGDERLNPALAELCRAGVLEITGGLIQNKYRILDPDAPQRTEFERLWDPE